VAGEECRKILKLSFEHYFCLSLPLRHIKHLSDLKIFSTPISEEREVEVVQLVSLLFLPWHTKYFQCSLSANFFSVCGRLLRAVFAEKDAAVTFEPFVIDTWLMMDT
jgi:hypothetical protein